MTDTILDKTLIDVLTRLLYNDAPYNEYAHKTKFGNPVKATAQLADLLLEMQEKRNFTKGFNDYFIVELLNNYNKLKIKKMLNPDYIKQLKHLGIEQNPNGTWSSSNSFGKKYIPQTRYHTVDRLWQSYKTSCK